MTASPPTANAAKKRQGRINRRPELEKHRPWPMELIQRAYPVLERLDRFRFLTSSQVANLEFLHHPNQHGIPRTVSAARKAANDVCLARLKGRGLVEVVPFPINRGKKVWDRLELNVLTRRGRDELVRFKEDQGLPYEPLWKPSYGDLNDFSLEKLPHLVAVNDAITALAADCTAQGVNLSGIWLASELEALGDQTRLEDVEPDALVVVTVGGRAQPYLLEIDLRTESVESEAKNSWRTKMRKYGRYFKERHPDDPLFFGLAKPLVLTITTGPERMRHLREETEAQGGRHTYWFSTREWSDPSGFGFFYSIWQVADGDGKLWALGKQLQLPGYP